jgi:ribosome-associated heat shock protein Hsp15
MHVLDEDTAAGQGRQRLDKWLWHARFFKSRSQATAAVAGGKVRVGGERAKASRAIGAGDLVEVTLGPRVVEVIVRGLPARRGPAPEARRAYEETAASSERGERFVEQRRIVSSAPRPPGRPDKHDRRDLLRLQRGQSDSDTPGGAWWDDD